MITVGQILKGIRESKQFSSYAQQRDLGHLVSVKTLRDYEHGRVAYIKPEVLKYWMEWLELTEQECEFLRQENVRCLVRSELSLLKALKVRPNLLASISDLVAMLSCNKQIDVETVNAQLTKHILPHLQKRPPLIDTIITRINKEHNE